MASLKACLNSVGVRPAKPARRHSKSVRACGLGVARITSESFGLELNPNNLRRKCIGIDGGNAGSGGQRATFKPARWLNKKPCFLRFGTKIDLRDFRQFYPVKFRIFAHQWQLNDHAHVALTVHIRGQ